jgi:hypothetical protein
MRTLLLVATLLVPAGLVASARAGQSPDASAPAVTSPAPADGTTTPGAMCDCAAGGANGQKCCAAAGSAAASATPVPAPTGEKTCGCGRKRSGS